MKERILIWLRSIQAKLLKLDAAVLEDVCAKVKQTLEDAASKF